MVRRACLALEAARIAAASQSASAFVTCAVARACLRTARSWVSEESTRGMSATAIKVIVSLGPRPSTICLARLRAASKRVGRTSVACMLAEASSKTITLPCAAREISL